MSIGPGSELVVDYDPTELVAKVERRRRGARSRLVSFVITLVVLGAIYAWRHDTLRGAGFFAVYGLLIAVSAAWWLAFFLAYAQARRALGSVRTGVALRADPYGVTVAEVSAAWPQVAGLRVVQGGLGRSAVLQLRLVDERTSEVPLDQVAVRPATLDGAVRAYSGGRHGVDLSALDV